VKVSSVTTWLTRRAKRVLAQLLDLLLPIRPGRMCFVTRAKVPLAGNLRIMLDTMADQGLHEIGFYKEGYTAPATLQQLQAKGVRVMQRYSLASLCFLLTSQTIVLSHSARDAYIARRKRGRRVVNLWHGVALKRIELLMPAQRNASEHTKHQELIKRNARIYDAMIASNATDRLVNALAFGVFYDNVHPTGLPRFDYLNPNYIWPLDLASQRQQLAQEIGERKLIVYAPTFRTGGATLGDLLPDKALKRIKLFCTQNNTVFGIRPHPYSKHELASMCDGQHIIDLSPQRYPEAAILLLAAQALVVDYSSIWVDYLLLQRPVVAHVPDLAAYTQRDRGFVYDMADVFPGPFSQSWASTLQMISDALQHGLGSHAHKYEYATKLLLPPPANNQAYSQNCASVIQGLAPEPSHTPFTFTEQAT